MRSRTRSRMPGRLPVAGHALRGVSDEPPECGVDGSVKDMVQFSSIPYQFHLEARGQIKLKHPPLARSLERPNEIEFSDGKSEEVQADGRARRAHSLTGSAQHGRPLASRPCDARVGKEGDFHGKRSIHSSRRSRRTEKREA